MIFSLVLLVVLFAVTVYTFNLPEAFASTAHIVVEKDMIENQGQPTSPAIYYDPYFIQTTFEIMQSGMVLSNVVAALNLNEIWGKKYFSGETLKTAESLEILKGRIQLSPIKNTKLIAITVYSDDKKDAADTANAIAKAYVDYRLSSLRDRIEANIEGMRRAFQQQEDEIRHLKVEFKREPNEEKQWNLAQLIEAHRLLFAKIEAEKIDLQMPKFLAQVTDIAQPAKMPFKPNKEGNITVGLILGAIAGVILGGIAVLYARRIENQSESTAC